MEKINFTVLIKQDEDGGYIVTVPALKSCYTQADTIPELLENTKEVIELCLEVQKDALPPNKFVGIQQVEIVL